MIAAAPMTGKKRTRKRRSFEVLLRAGEFDTNGLENLARERLQELYISVDI